MAFSNEQQHIPTSPIRFLLWVSRPHIAWFFGALVFATIAGVLTSGVPLLFRYIIDAANNGGEAIVVLWLILAYIGVTVASDIGWRLSGFIGMRWVTGLNATAYDSLFAYLSRHSHPYFLDRFAGSLSSKISHASEGAQSLAESFIWNYYPILISFVVTIVLMATASPLVALVFCALILILVPLNLTLTKRRRPHVVAYAQSQTSARGRLVDTITNISAVRQFARRDDEIGGFAAAIERMRTLNIRQWAFSEWILLINNLLIGFFTAAMLIVVYQLWNTGALTVGELVMVLTLMVSVAHYLVFIGSSMNGFIRRYGDIEEGLSDIVIPYEVIDVAPNAPQLKVPKGEIAFEHVAFQYHAQELFSDLNLAIAPGQRIGLVGHSGAGKSTLVSLLLRQYDLTGGAILIDGQDIREVSQDSLRENIAVVPQDPALFHRSIRENIAYGKPNATEEEVVRAATLAQAHEFIVSLPEGYETMVGERGVKLSGGQRQRIAIARAMLKDAPILILDEATSSLDSESEQAIQKALHVLMEGKTVIAIAHRLSTLREMNRIIVLSAGAVLEDGTHDELLKENGLYASLWAHQAGGFLQDE